MALRVNIAVHRFFVDESVWGRMSGSRKSEVGSRGSEAGSRSSEVGSQISEIRGRKLKSEICNNDLM